MDSSDIEWTADLSSWTDGRFGGHAGMGRWAGGFRTVAFVHSFAAEGAGWFVWTEDGPLFRSGPETGDAGRELANKALVEMIPVKPSLGQVLSEHIRAKLAEPPNPVVRALRALTHTPAQRALVEAEEAVRADMANEARLHPTLLGDIRSAINRHSAENGSNTPDYILADYLLGCLSLFDAATKTREFWYGRDGRFNPGGGSGEVPVDPNWKAPNTSHVQRLTSTDRDESPINPTCVVCGLVEAICTGTVQETS